mgnify:CR=1 FL=1
MIIKLKRPVEYCDKRYEEIDLDFDGLTGADSLSVSASLRKRFPREPVMQPETDERYLVALAARASKIDQEFFSLLALADFTMVKFEAQAFLLGAAGALEPEASPPATES